MTGQILKIEDGKVTIGVNGGGMYIIPIADVSYLGPKVGDRVSVYQDGNQMAVSKAEDSDWDQSQKMQGQAQTEQGGYDQHRNGGDDIKVYNKHLFTWLFSFILGPLGVDRFCRGQTGLGILKLLTGGAFGIWWLVDFIIAAVKAYGSPYSGSEEFVFINGSYSN